MTDIQIQMPAMSSRASSLKNNNNGNGNTGHDDVGKSTSQDDPIEPTSSSSTRDSAGGWYETLRPRISLLQKAGAELMSTFILVFAGCGAIMVDAHRGGVVTHVGVSLTFGLVVAAMIYTVGHISGAHMNPAVTIAFALTKHFPWRQVPVYVAAQCAGGIAASFALGLILHPAAFEGATLPSGSDVQSLVLEIIITFVLMFVISAVATDTRSCGELAGIAIGSTIALNVLMAKPISGASMNPARSIGPAIASSNYRALWVYIIGPIVGAAAGGLSYNLIRLPAKDMACDQVPAKSFRR